MPWIVCMTKPNQEAIASVNLARQHYGHYWPRFLQLRPNKPSLIRSLFPRYLFISIEQLWYSLRSTRGISHVLVGEGGRPQTLPDQFVANLRRREGADGLIQLSRAPAFEPGSTVKVEAGPLSGHLLIYDGMAPHERCKVLVSMLGMQVR